MMSGEMILATIPSLGDRPRFGALFVLCFIIICSCSSCERRPLVILDSLSVEGVKISLNPAFEPSIFRYSVIANELPGDIEITAAADQSLLISVNGQLTSSGATVFIDNLSVGDTVRIAVQRRALPRLDTVEYEVVYLPSNFPEVNVTVLKDGVSQDPLYVSLSGPDVNYIAILDNHGVPSFYRSEDQFALDFKWHAETGERSYARLTGTRNQWGRRESERVVLNTNFDEIQLVGTVGLSHTDHHDFLIQPDNELVFIAYDGTVRDLTGIGLTAEELIEDSVVQIIDRASRQVLFEWNSWDQLSYSNQLYEPKRAEYAHVNSVFVDSDGNLIISARGMSQVLKISRPGGQILWRLGGKTNQFRFINDPFSNICGQHNATRLENGNLLIFDNGQYCWPVIAERGAHTRIVEYRIEEQAREAELVWSYTQENAHTTAAGSAQRLPNGNTLIGWGRGPEMLATEITVDGTKVFEAIASIDGEPVITYRAFRFPK